MHPNVFLRTFWRSEIRPVVFVAMSFDPIFDGRFALIQEAVGRVSYRGSPLHAHRVDLSKSGDSILTEINDGIAHSALVLADVSIVYRSPDKKCFRNGNVMYEVGLALACRHPSEVLLIRDSDEEPLLFDVSTIPTMLLDFDKPEEATTALAEEVASRLREVDNVQDARVRLAVARMTAGERALLAKFFAAYGPTARFGVPETFGNSDLIARLIDHELVRAVGTHAGSTLLSFTPIGLAVAANLDALMPVVDKL